MKIRDWLEEHKVLFQTIPPIVIAGMAVLISFQTYKIMLYQAKLTKSEKVLILHFDVNRVGQPYEEAYREEVVISNFGSALQDFWCKDMVFLRVAYAGEWEKTIYGVLRRTITYPKILLTDYYDIILTGSQKGKLAVLKSPQFLDEGNLWKTTQAMRKFVDWVKAQDLPVEIEDWKMERYMQIQYGDISGEMHNEVYLIGEQDPYPEYIKLSKSKRDLIIQEYRKMEEEELYINCGGLCVELLYREWSKRLPALKRVRPEGLEEFTIPLEKIKRLREKNSE